MKLFERFKYFFSDKAIEAKVQKALDAEIEYYVAHEFTKREVAIQKALDDISNIKDYIEGTLQATITETLINILNNVLQGNTQNTGESRHNWINFEEGYYWKIKDSVLKELQKYDNSDTHADYTISMDLRHRVYSRGPSLANCEKVYYSVNKNLFDDQMKNILKILMNDDIIKAISKVDDKVNSEDFITDIVKRINDIQLKG